MYLIPIREAAKILRVNQDNFYNKKVKYNKYVEDYYGSKAFNLHRYREDMLKKERLKATATLLIEYLLHEENITLVDMSKLINVSDVAISRHNISYENCEVLLRKVKNTYPEEFDRFCKFYEFSNKYFTKKLGLSIF